MLQVWSKSQLCLLWWDGILQSQLPAVFQCWTQNINYHCPDKLQIWSLPLEQFLLSLYQRACNPQQRQVLYQSPLMSILIYNYQFYMTFMIHQEPITIHLNIWMWCNCAICMLYFHPPFSSDPQHPILIQILKITPLTLSLISIYSLIDFLHHYPPFLWC